MLPHEDNELLCRVGRDTNVEVDLDKVRPATLRLPIDADWKAASETARRAVTGKPSAAEVPRL